MTTMTWGERAKGWAWRYRLVLYSTLGILTFFLAAPSDGNIIISHIDRENGLGLWLFACAILLPAIDAPRYSHKKLALWLLFAGPVGDSLFFLRAILTHAAADQTTLSFVLNVIFTTLGTAITFAIVTPFFVLGSYMVDSTWIVGAITFVLIAGEQCFLSLRRGTVRQDATSAAGWVRETAGSAGTYASNHWRGRLPLGVSFFASQLAAGALFVSSSVFMPSAISATRHFRSLTFFVALAFLVLWGAIASWLVVGVLRAALREIGENRAQGRAIYLQGIAIAICFVFSAFLAQAMTGNFGPHILWGGREILGLNQPAPTPLTP